MFINYNQRALRSRSLRDGSLPHKGRFATFVRSCSALRASKRPLKISYLKSACLITPFGRWNQVNPTILEICLLYVNNNNKYSYEKFLYAKFGISALVYLLLLLEISLYLNYKCGFYSSISLMQSGQTNTQTHNN